MNNICSVFHCYYVRALSMLVEPETASIFRRMVNLTSVIWEEAQLVYIVFGVCNIY
jgi:hypothetical protein